MEDLSSSSNVTSSYINRSKQSRISNLAISKARSSFMATNKGDSDQIPDVVGLSRLQAIEILIQAGFNYILNYIGNAGGATPENNDKVKLASLSGSLVEIQVYQYVQVLAPIVFSQLLSEGRYVTRRGPAIRWADPWSPDVNSNTLFVLGLNYSLETLPINFNQANDGGWTGKTITFYNTEIDWLNDDPFEIYGSYSYQNGENGEWVLTVLFYADSTFVRSSNNTSGPNWGIDWATDGLSNLDGTYNPTGYLDSASAIVR
jgi:hypothetical protein